MIFRTSWQKKSADISNEEQLAIYIWWVDGNLKVHEDFIGINSLPNTKKFCFLSLTVFSKNFVINVWQGPKYISVHNATDKKDTEDIQYKRSRCYYDNPKKTFK